MSNCSRFECQYYDDTPCPYEIEINMQGTCITCPHNTFKCEDCMHYPVDCQGDIDE